MATPKKEEENINFDFTTPEINYILENAHFTNLQQNVFNRLVDIDGRQTIVKISIEEHISTATTSRVIRQIKNKILRIL
jgi:hypothetical protein